MAIHRGNMTYRADKISNKAKKLRLQREPSGIYTTPICARSVAASSLSRPTDLGNRKTASMRFRSHNPPSAIDDAHWPCADQLQA